MLLCRHLRAGVDARGDLSPLDIRRFHTQVAAETVAAEQLPARIAILAAGKPYRCGLAGAPLLELGLAERAPEVRPRLREDGPGSDDKNSQGKRAGGQFHGRWTGPALDEFGRRHPPTSKAEQGSEGEHVDLI